MDIFLRFKKKKHAEAYTWDLELQIHRRLVMVTVGLVVGTVIFVGMYAFNPKVGNRASQILLAVRFILAVLGLLGNYLLKKYMCRLKPQAPKLIILLDIIGCASQFAFYPVVGSIAVDNFNKLGIYVWAWCAAFVAFTVYFTLCSWWMKVINVLVQKGFFFYFVIKREPAFIPILTLALSAVFTFLALTYAQERFVKLDFLEKMKILDNYEAIKRIFDDISQGIIIADTKFNIIYANRTVSAMFKRQTSETSVGIQELFSEVQVKAVNPPLMSLITERIMLSQENMQENSLYGMLERVNNSLFHSEPPTTVVTAETYWIDPNNRSNKKQFSIKFTPSLFMDEQVIVINITDTTDRDSLIAAEASSEYKTRLLSSVSHELRTPLNGSINFLEQTITEYAVPIAVKDKWLIPALRCNRLLLSLVNDILDFSQMHAGKLRLVFEAKSVTETAKECIELLELQAQKKQIQLKLQNNLRKKEETLHTDHNRLKQVMLNLLSNAVKFTFEGGVTLFLDEVAIAHPQTSLLSYDDSSVSQLKGVKITCQDSGIGISSENQEKLFQSFEKLDLGNHDLRINATGAGLGLVISNNIVQRLSPEEVTGREGEIIRFKSKENEGSSFFFTVYNRTPENILRYQHPTNAPDFIHDNETLMTIPDVGMGFKNTTELMRTMPIKLDTPRTGNGQGQGQNDLLLSPYSNKASFLSVNLTATDNLLNSPKINCDCPKILIVDDDSFNLTALDQILSKLKISCTWAFNGKQAIEKIETRQQNRCCKTCYQYKLMFLDCQMPVMDGFETAKALKEMMKKREIDVIKIVACTAFVQKSDEAKARESGMDDFCTKPINFAVIKEKLAAADFWDSST